MLTHCPECQKELSTAATQCPHCGAPVSQGQLSGGGPPVAKPVQQPGYYPQPMQPQAPPPPKSNCLRNCLIFGCLLVVLGFCGVFGSIYYLAKRIVKTDPTAVMALGQELAPGATVPPKFKPIAGLNWDFKIGDAPRAKGVFLANGDQPDPNQNSVIAFGALDTKRDSKQLSAEFQKALDQINQQQQGGTPAGSGGGDKPKKVEKQEEVELLVGGEPVKFLHMIAIDERTGKKQECYFTVLEGWNNEFGWLGVAGVGPDGAFDLEGFKAFLATLKKK